MKPLHKIKYTDSLRPVFEWIQVKDGRVCVLCPHFLIVLPAEEVFGKDITHPDEELYFEKRLWQSAKFDKADQITRDGLAFNSTKNYKTLGTIIALTGEDFADKVGKYPDWPCVVPDPKTPLNAIEQISFDYTFLFELCSAFALNPQMFQLFFRGGDKAIIVLHPDTKGFGLLMPFLNDHDFNYPETEKKPEPETAENDDLL